MTFRHISGKPVLDRPAPAEEFVLTCSPVNSFSDSLLQSACFTDAVALSERIARKGGSIPVSPSLEASPIFKGVSGE